MRLASERPEAMVCGSNPAPALAFSVRFSSCWFFTHEDRCDQKVSRLSLVRTDWALHGHTSSKCRECATWRRPVNIGNYVTCVFVTAAFTCSSVCDFSMVLKQSNTSFRTGRAHKILKLSNFRVVMLTPFELRPDFQRDFQWSFQTFENNSTWHTDAHQLLLAPVVRTWLCRAQFVRNRGSFGMFWWRLVCIASRKIIFQVFIYSLWIDHVLGK